MTPRPRVGRKLLVASIGIASVAYAACERGPAAPPPDLGPPALDAGALPEPSASALPVSDPPATRDAGATTPDAGTAAPRPAKTLTIRVTPDDKITLDYFPVTQGELEKQLREAISAGPADVHVFPDPKASNAAITRVLEIVSKEGLKVSLMMRKPSGPSVDEPVGNLMAPPPPPPPPSPRPPPPKK